MKYLRHLRYVVRHKWFVFLAACRLGIPWLGVIHDWTKFLPSEVGPYSNFTRTKPATDAEKAAFNIGWLHHQRRNKHHWQWWCLLNSDGAQDVLAMPDRYLREMVADWRGAGRAQGKPDTLAWYLEHRDEMTLHPDTREVVEDLLGVPFEEPKPEGDGDNVCCPGLEIVLCHDTEEHKHFICPDGPMPDNDWVRCFCMAEWGECEYFKR